MGATMKRMIRYEIETLNRQTLFVQQPANTPV
jgi:hypothetical protein